MKRLLAIAAILLASGCATLTPAEYAAQTCAPYSGEAYQFCVGLAMQEAQFRAQQRQQAMQAMSAWAFQMSALQKQQQMLNRYRNTPQRVRIVP